MTDLAELKARVQRVITGIVVLGAFALFLLVGAWNSVFHYVGPGQMLVVVSKSGKDLPPGELLAGDGQKGPQRQVLGEGRHFVVPVFYEVELHPVVDVPPGQVGVVTARVGTDLPPGEILAAPGQKGIQRAVLPPGRHRLNPYGYKVEVKPATVIRPGYVGFVTSLVGAPPTRWLVVLEGAYAGTAHVGSATVDPQVAARARAAVTAAGGALDEADLAAHGRAWGTLDRGQVDALRKTPGVADLLGPFAGPGEKGVWHDVLQPGLYYLNPYAQAVREVEVGINQISFLGHDQIAFPSSDAFDIRLDATVEWELHPRNVALVMAEFGARKEIEDKVLVAQSRSIGRLEGSKYGAKDFLLGEGRRQIQEAFTSRLWEKCREKHVTVHSAYIRHISIPDNLLAPIRESFVAQEIERTAKVQEETRKSAAALQRERSLIVQRKQEVHAETEALVQRLRAEANRQVAEIEATTRRLVAEKQQEIAVLDAQRTKLLGEAQAGVARLLGEARAGLFRLKVGAFKGDADAFARYTFAEDLADDLQVRLVQTGQGTFWTDLDRSTGLTPPTGALLDQQQRKAPAAAPAGR
ncbi:MAG: SPFH domain-containing protein [Planctomycetes bacterium]|nr:SPFH domain-containing protein [Planctomycetota bacterium]